MLVYLPLLADVAQPYPRRNERAVVVLNYRGYHNLNRSDSPRIGRRIETRPFELILTGPTLWDTEAPELETFSRLLRERRRLRRKNKPMPGHLLLVDPVLSHSA